MNNVSLKLSSKQLISFGKFCKNYKSPRNVEKAFEVWFETYYNK